MPRKRLVGLFDVFLAGLILFGLYIGLVYFLNVNISFYLWIAGFIWGVILYIAGFNYYRIVFSFSLSFLTIVSLLYVILILLIVIPGIPEAIAIALLPLVLVAITGYLHNNILKTLIGFIHSIVKKREIRNGGAYIYSSGITGLLKRIRSAMYKIDPIMWFFIIVGLVILVAFLVIPIIMMFYHAFEVTPYYANFYKIFRSHLENPMLRSKYVRLKLFPMEKPWRMITTAEGEKILFITGVNYGILLNSLINASIVTTIATILGIIIAFVLARYDFPGKTFLRVLAIVPLFVTPFVNSYVVKILFSEAGPVSMITKALFGYAIRIDKLAGVTLAQIMAFYPIVYLNAYSSFINVDPTMEEQAENLGAKGLRLFFTVTLPLALPGIIAGSIIVFIFSLEDLGAPIVFQEPWLISYQIYSSFTSETGFVSPEIAALGIVLLFLAVMGFLAIRSYVGMRTYAMISRGGRWMPREHRLRWKGKILVYFIIFPLILFTAFPQIGVILLAFNIMPPYGFSINFDKATPEYFLGLFENPDTFTYIRNTLTYSLTAVVIATIIAIMVAYSVSRAKIKIITPAMDTLATIPLAIPGLVVALGYVYFFSALPDVLSRSIGEGLSILVFGNTISSSSLLGIIGFSTVKKIYDLLLPISPLSPAFNAGIVLVIAYSIRKLPFIVRSVFAGFQQVHEALEEAALNLGASRSRVIFGVILPFIVTYIISGAVIGFVYISTEVSTSITIGGLKPSQAPMTFYMKNLYAGGTVYGAQIVASMGVLLILFQLIAILTIVFVFKQRYAFIGA